MSIEPDCKISVVIPVFMSAQFLEELYRRLNNVLVNFGEAWEIIMVDDASTDGSYLVMQQLRAKDKRVKIIQLARNQGQHHATLCGLKSSSGKYVITLDDDLQNPPKEFPKILHKLEERFNAVIV